MSLRPLRRLSLLSLLLCTLAGCGSMPDAPDEVPALADPPAPHVAQRAAELLAGRFDSSAQAAADARYFAVQLRACRIALPSLGEDVLYIEQAMLSATDQPYRQRVYVLTSPDDATVYSDVHELRGAERFVGLCDHADDERTLPPPEDVQPMTGCRVTLHVDGDALVGATDGSACLNDHAGATYATSEVRLASNLISSWDRGYDAQGVQVWGATAGAYRFDRQE